MPSPSPAGTPATLSDRLDRIFDAIHDGTPDDVRLCDVMGPFVDPDAPHPEDESTGRISWLSSTDLRFDVLGDVEANVVAALRGFAAEINAAADRVEGGAR